MATQSTFLCECGEILGRMNKSVKWLPWNSDKGDPKMKGVQCNKCLQGYLWIQPEPPQQWVDVQKCCKTLMCDC